MTHDEEVKIAEQKAKADIQNDLDLAETAIKILSTVLLRIEAMPNKPNLELPLQAGIIFIVEAIKARKRGVVGFDLVFDIAAARVDEVLMDSIAKTNQPTIDD